MSAQRASWAVEQADAAADFEPFVPDGIRAGEIHWLRRHDAGGNLAAAVWRSAPHTFSYVFDSDEACFVLEGEASVDLLDEDTTVDLRPGDIAYFASGTRAVWRVKTPFRKFVVGPVDAPPAAS
jgi:uncharacterized cupin superfamily protein